MVGQEKSRTDLGAQAAAEAQAQTVNARALRARHCTNDSPGAPPSNTAPANDNSSSVRILRSGVDSLYLSFHGQLADSTETELDRLKVSAQSDKPVERSGSVLQILSHRFEVKPRGFRRFPFVLVDNWFHLSLSRSSAQSLPMAYVQVRSEPLSRAGVHQVDHLLDLVINQLGEKRKKLVSRIDLCIDFLVERHLSEISSLAWVKRSKKYNTHEVDNHFTGFSFGYGGGLSARLYDKSKEIESSGKVWLYDLWAENGWLGELPVWRLEFQFDRATLNDFGLSSVKEVRENLNQLWRYATTEWLRLVVPSDSDSRKSRWPVDPMWAALQKVQFGPDRQEGLWRVPKQRLPSRQHMFINGLGGITTFMALNGITNIDEAVQQFINEAHAYHLENYRHTGKTLSEYTRLKAMEKAKRFNVRFKVNPEDLDPEAYRKAKWGE